MNNYFALAFENDSLTFLDQTKLPFVEEYITTDSYERISQALERLEIRGAPAIGMAAAFALTLAIKMNSTQKKFEEAFNRLAITRPTAVNLFWALNEMKKVYEVSSDGKNVYKKLLRRAKEIQRDDALMCEMMAQHGISIFHKKSTVLTHCNTGALAAEGGTAFNIIKNGFEHGLVALVYVDETRPLLQGSRLTAYELSKNEIPFEIITDSTAASLFLKKKIDLVITGADRITAKGDAANKIGTYNLAVLCKYHEVPFYIAAPTSTIDTSISHYSEIPIELRSSKEITSINEKQITLENYPCYNPSFDVTPADLISGIITEKRLFTFPYHFK
ncbi:MAG: S-methyl-5-thioribose-1-phosphate isomerase [Ignavibacteria bacterium CG_4_9_14_0_2_um_filter_37_13]|nr:MAG: S-methyl-5-thioribose-1-phosphate isomerase [Ignavibacteria bacterium CG_4_9_14_0_2_um_filter_37_13]